MVWYWAVCNGRCCHAALESSYCDRGFLLRQFGVIVVSVYVWNTNENGCCSKEKHRDYLQYSMYYLINTLTIV